MAYAVQGTAATTQKDAGGTSHTINLPGSIAAGELLSIMLLSNGAGVTHSATDWTSGPGGNVGAPTSNGTFRILYKTATGSEGATVTVTTGGDAATGGVAWRATGHAATPYPSAAVLGAEASEDPFTLAADTITGIDADNLVLLAWGHVAGTRTITTLDADLTLIGSATGGGVGYCCHVAYETAPGTGNADYSTDMSSAVAFGYILVELAAAAGGSAALTGTITTAVESDIVTGGKTIILTLTGDTWIPAA